MTAISNRILVFFFTCLLLVAAGCYAYLQEFYFLAIPFIILLSFLLIQHPQYLFYLLMLSIPWSVEYNFTPSLGTDLPDEPLMLMCSAAVVFFVVYRRKDIKWQNSHPLIGLMALQFIWITLTAIASTNTALSVKYLLAKSWYVLAFLALPLFLFKNEKVFKRSVILLLLSMLAVMLVTVFRHLQHNLSFEKINEALEPFYRNHVNYSALLVFMVPIQIAILRVAHSQKIKFIFSCLLVISIGALYFSYARGAWLALAAGLASYWLIKKKILLLAYIFFLLLTVAGVFWIKNNDRFVELSNDYESTIFHTDFREHLVATYKLQDLSNAERIHRWVAGIRMIKDSWRTGFGPSTFYSQYKTYTLPAFKTYVSNNQERSTVHNYFLLLLVEQGIIGCLLFIFLIGALFWYAQKIYHRTNDIFWSAVTAAAAIVLVMQCVINFLSDMIETDKAGSVFYLCIAAIIIADLKTRNPNSYPSSDIQSIS